MNPYLKRQLRPTHGQKAERRAAKRLGGRLTPASGAIDGAKGDIVKRLFLIESKATQKLSLALKLEWLAKIAKEALDAQRDPAVAIQFVDSQGRSALGGRWVLIPERVFNEISE